MSSGRGAVKGWCIESQRFSSSFHSTMGKSTTQTNFHCAPHAGTRFMSFASLRRMSPSILLTRDFLSAPKTTRSPFSRPSFATSASLMGSRNFATPVANAPFSNFE